MAFSMMALKGKELLLIDKMKKNSYLFLFILLVQEIKMIKINKQLIFFILSIKGDSFSFYFVIKNTIVIY